MPIGRTTRRTRTSCAMFFFFSSRRRHTRFDCDWSSDVCSSDLHGDFRTLAEQRDTMNQFFETLAQHWKGGGPGMYPIAICLVFAIAVIVDRVQVRSEERRVGKECRSRWSPYH